MNSVRIFFLSLILFSLTTQAMENEYDFHAPKLAEQLRAIAELHANKANIIGDNVKEYAKDGFFLPMGLAVEGGAALLQPQRC